MKTVVIKCNLADADFIVSNILPIEKSTRDLEIILPVEIDDTTSDPFKFLSERKDIVMEWKFLEELEEEVKQEIETKETLPEVSDIELGDEDTIDKSKRNGEDWENWTREAIANSLVLKNPFELDKFIVVFCKLFSSKPNLLPFSKLWETEYLQIYGENKFSYGEENLRRCAEILEIWDREKFPLIKIGTEIRKWLVEEGRSSLASTDTVSYIIEKLLTWMER